jgi:predicted DNA-binding protein YlxM (UPF0122 family)
MDKKLPVRENKKVNMGKAIKLRFKNGLSYQAIADYLNCSKSAVHKALKPLEKLIRNPNEIESFKLQRTNILTGVEMKLIESLVDEEKHKKASLNKAAYAFQQIHNARRLEEGLSTTNLAVNVEKKLTEAHEKAQKMSNKLRDSAGYTVSET